VVNKKVWLKLQSFIINLIRNILNQNNSLNPINYIDNYISLKIVSILAIHHVSVPIVVISALISS